MVFVMFLLEDVGEVPNSPDNDSESNGPVKRNLNNPPYTNTI